MPQPHPKLCLRPRPHPGLKRPNVQHPILGPLEFINDSDGWWRGTAPVAGTQVRLDVYGNANVSEAVFNVAADFLQWIQQNEPTLRMYAGQRLAVGEYRSNLKQHAEPCPTLDDPAILAGLQPAFLILWPDHADLSYDCDGLPGGSVLGAHCMEVSINAGKTPTLVSLMDLGLWGRAEFFLTRPVPAYIAEFEDSIADQLIAQAAANWGSVPADAEMKRLVREALEFTEGRINTSPQAFASYLKSARRLLLEIARTIQAPETVVERIILDFRVRHPAGKRLPFRKKLVFAPTDRATFDGGGPSVRLLDVTSDEADGSPEAFAAIFRDRLQEAAGWLARQSPAVFQELRAAGFVTEIFMYVVARIEADLPEWSLPAEFVAECGRHGFGLTVVGSNSAKWYD